MTFSSFGSVQHYPNIYCFGPTAANTNISNYLTHTTGERYSHSISMRIDYLQRASRYPAVSYSGFQSAGVASATAAGIPVIMSEANSCACGGCPLISPTVSVSRSMHLLHLPDLTLIYLVRCDALGNRRVPRISRQQLLRCLHPHSGIRRYLQHLRPSSLPEPLGEQGLEDRIDVLFPPDDERSHVQERLHRHGS